MCARNGLRSSSVPFHDVDKDKDAWVVVTCWDDVLGGVTEELRKAWRNSVKIQNQSTRIFRRRRIPIFTSNLHGRVSFSKCEFTGNFTQNFEDTPKKVWIRALHFLRLISLPHTMSQSPEWYLSDRVKKNFQPNRNAILYFSPLIILLISETHRQIIKKFTIYICF